MPRTKGRARKAISRLARAAALPAEARETRSDLGDEHFWNASRLRLLFVYPHMPSNPIDEILDLAFTQQSGCIGYSGELEDPKKIDQLVTIYIRHTLTDYQSLEASFGENNKWHISKRLAIAAVSDTVEQIADTWRNGPSSNTDAISRKILGKNDRENVSSITPGNGCGALPSCPIIAAVPAQFNGPFLQNNKTCLPTMEEVQNTARSRKPQLSSWHSKAGKKAHDPRSKVSKRKAPFYSGRNAGKLELAFARMDLTSIVQSNTTDVDVDRTQNNARPETQMAILVAETSALGLHDTVIAYKDDIQLSRVHSDQEPSSDATISDPVVEYQEPSKRRVGSSAKAQKRNTRLKCHTEAVRAAERSLQALTQNQRPNANRIAKASTRLETTRARLAKYLLRKQREQEKAALKATIRPIQARAPEANAN